MMQAGPQAILVTLTKDIPPSGRAGESRLLPTALAQQLLAAGDAIDPRDRQGRPLQSPLRKGRYETKKG